MPRPIVFPFCDLTQSNQVDWLIAPRRGAGYVPGQPVPSAEHNTLWYQGGWWLAYADYGSLHVEDFVDASTNTRLSADRLEYTIGDNIAATGATPTTLPVYWFNGFRVAVDQQILAPASAYPLLLPDAVYPARVWIYLSTPISLPSSPLPEIRVERVAPATPDSPAVGELTLCGVDADALGFITALVYAGTEPDHEVRFASSGDIVFASFTRAVADFHVESPGVLRATTSEIQNLTVGDAGSLLPGLTAVACSGIASIVAYGNGVDTAVTVDGDTAGAMFLTSQSNAAPVLRIEQAGTANGISIFSTGASPMTGIYAEGATSGFGGEFFGGDIAAGVKGWGGTITGPGVAGASQSPGAAGVQGTGSNNAGSQGVLASATHVDATALQAQTAGAATTTANALYGVAVGAATALRTLAVNGYAAIFQTDTTSPTRAAVRFVPQDADPTTPLQGDLLFNSSRAAGGKLRVRSLTAYESVHSTERGLVFAFNSAANIAGLVGASGNQALTQISPEQTGRVLITASIGATPAVDNAAWTLSIIDVTAGGAIVAALVIRGLNTGGASRGQTDVLRADYTLPSAVTRTFALTIATGSAVDITNIVLSVQGVIA